MNIHQRLNRLRKKFISDCVVTGHDFSRAIPAQTWKSGFSPCSTQRPDAPSFDFSPLRSRKATRRAHPIKTLLLATALAAFSSLCPAQTAPPAQSAPAPPTPAAQPADAAAPQPKGTVIFSRATDENGDVTQTGEAASPPAVQAMTAPLVEDADREAVTFTALDLDVHLRPHAQADAQQITVRALLTIRNDGKTPLKRIPLQISSSLHWDRIRIEGKDLPVQVATLNSDADHTGQLREATVTPAQPLAPGASVQVDADYSGTISISAQRLLALGTPDEVALRSDWDEISPAFTGLRGFGNVAWYPVASVPVILGDGARLFDEIGRHKLRLMGAHFRLRLTVEFPHGKGPTVAFINGRNAALAVTESGDLDQNQEVASVATAGFDGQLGFEAPSLFVAQRTEHKSENLTAWTLPQDEVSQQAWATAADAVTPFLQGWLGLQPRAPLALLDLPDPKDAPFEAGSLLVAPLGDASQESLQGVLVHAMTHAWLASAHPRPAWLDEGVANFIGVSWTEKKQGRAQALSSLEAGRSALALVEPESPGQGIGVPLTEAISPVYYRAKAAYVLWMLRDIVGDQALSAALRGLGATAADASGPSAGSAFEKLIEQASPGKDLRWFFADWVDADKGLPDLAIEGVFPTSASAGNWLVAVNLANNGYAAVEVPLTVRSATSAVTHRVLIPGRGKTVERILVQGNPTEVQLNDGSVPETQATVHRTKLEKDAESSSSSQTAVPPQ